VLRLSDPAAATQVAVAVSHVLIRLGQLLQAAEDVSAREILLGVTEIFPRHAEVLSGFTEVIAAVAVVMVTMVTMMAMVMVLMIEQITQETSGESCEWQKAEHSVFSLVARGARACSMLTPGCLQTGP
jgi:hypothetical protein